VGGKNTNVSTINTEQKEQNQQLWVQVQTFTTAAAARTGLAEQPDAGSPGMDNTPRTPTPADTPNGWVFNIKETTPTGRGVPRAQQGDYFSEMTFDKRAEGQGTTTFQSPMVRPSAFCYGMTTFITIDAIYLCDLGQKRDGDELGDLHYHVYELAWNEAFSGQFCGILYGDAKDVEPFAPAHGDNVAKLTGRYRDLDEAREAYRQLLKDKGWFEEL